MCTVGVCQREEGRESERKRHRERMTVKMSKSVRKFSNICSSSLIEKCER